MVRPYIVYDGLSYEVSHLCSSSSDMLTLHITYKFTLSSVYAILTIFFENVDRYVY